MSLEDALEDLRAANPNESISYTKLAKKHGVWRSTLTRREQGVHASRAAKAVNQRLLTPQDEEELVQYICGLTERHLMPTRQMIKNFAAPIAKREISESWVTRFINRHKDQLISIRTTPMDSVRHKADSGEKYRLYFELLHRKTAEYDVEPEHTYNMDEKGFAIGVTGRSKRIFSKALYGKKQYRQSLQDGNTEWVTLLACICADGSALPPGIIYAAAGRAVQQSWVNEIDPSKHSVHFTTSPSGWTNDDLGLTWLEQVFNRYTKPKPRRKRRLLIIDGHGSHVTRDFIRYCDGNKILLMIYPPHSTHTLQPLDVVCFKPLSQNYSKELDMRTHRTQGWLPIKKSDFFRLFWTAWVATFTEKLILSSFEATGVHPPNADVILDRFTQEKPTTPEAQLIASNDLGEPSWLKAKSLLHSVVKDKGSIEARALEGILHHLSTQNELLHYELDGAKEALTEKQKQSNKLKVLPLQSHEIEYHGGAKWWSPRARKEAEVRWEVSQRLEEEEAVRKADKKELQANKKLLEAKEKEEKRVAREAAALVREKEKTEKATQVAERKAERERLKEARNTEKALQLSQKGKRKALEPPAAKKTQKRRAVAAVGGPPAAAPAPALQPKVNSRGRHIKPPKKFE